MRSAKDLQPRIMMGASICRPPPYYRFWWMDPDRFATLQPCYVMTNLDRILAVTFFFIAVIFLRNGALPHFSLQ